MNRDRPDNPCIDSIEYLCPDIVDDADMYSHLEGLETMLSDVDSAHAPHLKIICSARKTAGDVLKPLLERSVFSQYPSKPQKISLYLDGKQRIIKLDKILSTPTHFTQGGVTIPLSTDQRVEWLLRDGHNTRDRDRYLHDLLEAARATIVTADAGSQLAISTLPEAEVGLSVPTKIIEGGERGDEGVGVGEEQSSAGSMKHSAERQHVDKGAEMVDEP